MTTPIYGGHQFQPRCNIICTRPPRNPGSIRNFFPSPSPQVQPTLSRPPNNSDPYTLNPGAVSNQPGFPSPALPPFQSHEIICDYGQQISVVGTQWTQSKTYHSSYFYNSQKESSTSPLSSVQSYQRPVSTKHIEFSGQNASLQSPAIKSQDLSSIPSHYSCQAVNVLPPPWSVESDKYVQDNTDHLSQSYECGVSWSVNDNNRPVDTSRMLNQCCPPYPSSEDCNQELDKANFKGIQLGSNSHSPNVNRNPVRQREPTCVTSSSSSTSNIQKYSEPSEAKMLQRSDTNTFIKKTQHDHSKSLKNLDSENRKKGEDSRHYTKYESHFIRSDESSPYKERERGRYSSRSHSKGLHDVKHRRTTYERSSKDRRSDRSHSSGREYNRSKRTSTTQSCHYRQSGRDHSRETKALDHTDSNWKSSSKTYLMTKKRSISEKRMKSLSPDIKHHSKDYKYFNPLKKIKNDDIQDQEYSRSSNEYSNDDRTGEESEIDQTSWLRCSPADLYYQRNMQNSCMYSTEKLKALHDTFRSELVERTDRIKVNKPKFEAPPRKTKIYHLTKEKSESCSSSSNEECESEEEEENPLKELERKKLHPDRLHEELWYNDQGEMNDGPLCRCSAKAQRSGIRHGIYSGEAPLPPCDPNSNNSSRLHHYLVTMSPHTNFLTKCPTLIKHDGHEFIFEGFSMFSHEPLGNIPTCRVIRFNIEYTVVYLEEKFPEHFTVEGLELFSKYLFQGILELVDLNWKAHGDLEGCPRFHFMPRFARALEDNGKELLSMNVVLQYLLTSNIPLVEETQLKKIVQITQYAWQDIADEVKGMIITCPGKKPCSLRVDQLDREICDPDKGIFPEVVHFGMRPPQLCYAGNPTYQKAWRDYVKFRHLLANKPKVSYADRHKLLQKEMRLQEMRMKSDLKRDITVVVSSKNFYRTGIMCDIVQHAMLLPVLVCHLRFHLSLGLLEKEIGHQFKNRFLLQLALTHPSYRENFGTNPDHARNSLTNCGIRQPEYGDRRIHYVNTRKRGINTLINIMSRFGQREETTSNINHNERLEFLGDAVVEFLSSIHLFYMFPDLEEGGLATYRAAVVQNQHLAVLAKKLQLEKYMLYAHGSDLCHDLELRHAMANCFEALMGALFLDGNIEVADRVFSQTLFSEPELLEVWVNYPPHPLQEQEPEGDRQWIESVPLLKKLHEFENATGIEFTHIRLLARSFTHRSVGYNNLTLGSNQRLEFLGDTVLQLVASEYLYKYFPEHHEGHLSLLRSSLVNNRTQSVVCDDLGMVEFAIYPYPKGELKTKDRADLLEAFLGALYVDKGLKYCRYFCQVCFFPRLQDFIMNQDWNDPKSKLQQCCLTLRSMDGGEPDIPVYKVVECKGPTNTRVYTVAVYFRGQRLATGTGHSIQQAEMAAAHNALKASKNLFPQLSHQRRVIEQTKKHNSSKKKKKK
ncbi:ribonuclease 3 drosha [Tachypleus tridentatus]|uniref:ribonuclease 3 drosha n=1 Tax=Tachypleus tridentatus TaxID=6853 RepID=UPI003FD361D0